MAIAVSRTTFQRTVFPIPAICAQTGAIAAHTYNKDDDDIDIIIGENITDHVEYTSHHMSGPHMCLHANLGCKHMFLLHSDHAHHNSDRTVLKKLKF